MTGIRIDPDVQGRPVRFSIVRQYGSFLRAFTTIQARFCKELREEIGDLQVVAVREENVRVAADAEIRQPDGICSLSEPEKTLPAGAGSFRVVLTRNGPMDNHDSG